MEPFTQVYEVRPSKGTAKMSFGRESLMQQINCPKLLPETVKARRKSWCRMEHQK